MASERTSSPCLHCGAPGATSASGGYCARCLFQGLFAASASGAETSEAGENGGGFASKPGLKEKRELGSFGNYDLLSEIARGGMGIVYRAQQRNVQRTVALKMVLSGRFATESELRRFRMETEAIAHLDHPNIVPIYEVGDVEGQPYFTMKWVEGGNLATEIDRFHKDHRLGAKLLATIARAVHHAHQRGVLHRDIKPANILLDASGDPFITDFGLARRVETDSDLTVTGAIIGSPNFMAPEQASGNSRQVSTAADIYSLGAILYFILTRRPPFVAETALETLRLVQEHEVRPPSSVRLKTDRELETICLKCLQKEPAKRYGSALELAEDLERWLRQENILARRSTPAERAIKWVKRKPAVAALSFAIVVLLLTLAIGSPIAAFRIDRERKRVQEEAKRAEEQRKLAVQRETEARSQLYTTRISTAQREWEQSRFPLVTQLIEQTRNDPDRGFEWYFWRRQIHQGMAVLRGHLWSVTALAFSADGSRIATGSDDAWCIVWDASSFRELAIFKNHRASIRAIAWAPDGRRVISSGDDHWIRIWNAADGTEIASVFSPRGRVASIDISSDGQRLVSANQDGTASIWEIATLREQRTFERHADSVLSAQFSARADLLVTGSADGECKLWDVVSGALIRTLQGHASYVRSAAFSPDAKWIVSGGDDNTARIWETASGRLLHILSYGSWVRSVRFSPDGRLVAAAGDDGAAKIWQAGTGQELTMLRMHEDQIRSLAFSPDGKRLMTGSRDQMAKLWTLGAKLDVIDLSETADKFRFVAFSHDGRIAVAINEAHQIRLWDAANGGGILLKSEADEVLAAGFPSDGDRVLTLSWRGEIGMLTFMGEKRRGVVLKPRGNIWSAAFSRDARRVATGGHRGEVSIWEVATGRELFLKGHGNVVRAVAFSPNGARLATAGDEVRLWNAETGQLVSAFQAHAGGTFSVAFSSDSRRLVTAGSDRRARVWDVERGTELLTLHGHGYWVSSAAFSPDGRRILTASEDGTAKLWHATSGMAVLTLEPELKQPLTSAAFSPDGDRIMVGGGNGMLRIWDAASADQVAAWDEEDKQRVEHLAHVRRERVAAWEEQRAARARSPGTIRQWLLLGPIFITSQGATPAALDEEIVPGEAQLRPRAGDRAQAGGVEFAWQPIQHAFALMDIDQILGRISEYSAAYAVCYVYADREQRGLRLLVGTDDFAKIYLNGRTVYETRLRRGYVEDEDVVEGVQLNAGTNVLVLKLVNVTSLWMVSARFTDAAGGPVEGIKTVADREPSPGTSR